MTRSSVRYVTATVMLALIAGAWPTHAVQPNEPTKPCGTELSPLDRIEVDDLKIQLPPGADVPPEGSLAGQLRTHPALDVRIARRALLKSNDLLRRPHLNVALASLGKVRVSIPVEGQITEPSSPPTVSKTLIIRTRVPLSPNPLPVASLSLGLLHYRLRLATLIPLPSVPGKAGPRFARGRHVTFGAAARRGVFSAELLSAISAEGEVTSLFSMVPRDVRVVQGTWTFEHEWLTLRLLTTESTVEKIFN